MSVKSAMTAMSMGREPLRRLHGSSPTIWKGGWAGRLPTVSDVFEDNSIRMCGVPGDVSSSQLETTVKFRVKMSYNFSQRFFRFVQALVESVTGHCDSLLLVTSSG